MRIRLALSSALIVFVGTVSASAAVIGAPGPEAGAGGALILAGMAAAILRKRRSK